MRRPTTATFAALATAGLAFTGVACTGAGGGDADTGTEDPVVLDPGEEQGETLLPGTPSEVEGDEG